ncbi:RNA polymerase sigma factor [Posidoniimonas corsicana]|uniref:RNA polymerase sigma factor n=1 Tax=Posidoniimonas corsicana TaxID=1938618 RepID=A0A5C5VA23_9BACT|nr:sigma-70 family RNA polymerase sigma factor [Posidoniimonas corsicana]TWT35454.1 RNA polymerase sigma factor [Posidoniimonas corsicana]
MTDGPTFSTQEGAISRNESESEFVRLLTGAQCSLRGYILALLAGQKKEADDVLQSTNMTIWEKRAEYDHSKPFLPWAMAFAFHRIQAFRRDAARNRLVFSDTLIEMLHAYSEQSLANPPGAQDHLRDCLEKLTPAEQDLIHKRYYGRCSVESLSSMVSKSAGSVANRLFRIREKLRNCIQFGIVQSGHEG